MRRAPPPWARLASVECRVSAVLLFAAAQTQGGRSVKDRPGAVVRNGANVTGHVAEAGIGDSTRGECTQSPSHSHDDTRRPW